MSKLLEVLCDPRKVAYHVRWRFEKWRQVKRVRRDGQLFHEYLGELYPDHLMHGNAQSFIAEKAAPYCQGQGIDVGADRWPFRNAQPVRNEPHQNAYRLDRIPDGSLDFVFSSHCLEHLERWADALRLWISKLRPGGVLFLYLPHKAMKLWNPGSPYVLDEHRWQPDIETLLPFLREHGMEILDHQPDHDNYWSFHIAARRI
jgi:SAM-dependent methyltransferase